ncbi:MAG: hypothetical protein WKH64_02875 [Chloroflexia bacterium]
MQSFGGGSATLFLYTEPCPRAWLDVLGGIDGGAGEVSDRARHQSRGATILIGSRLGGPIGAAVSVVGLLLPSVGITVLMTAAFTEVRDLPRSGGAARRCARRRRIGCVAFDADGPAAPSGQPP